MPDQIDGVKIAVKKETVKEKTVKKPVTRKKLPPEGTMTEPDFVVKKTKEQGGGLTTFVAIAITALIVGGAIYSWQQNNTKKSIDETKKSAEDTKSNLENELTSLKNKLLGIETENQELKNVNQQLQSTTKLLEGAIKEFSSDDLGISFEYPAKYGDINLAVEDGNIGKKFTGTFSNNKNLIFGGITEDYTSSSTNDFLISRGFSKSKSKYYFTDAAGSLEMELEPIQIIGSGVNEVVIVDKSSFLYNEGEEPRSETLGDNELGALVNIGNDDFGGIAFWNKNKEKLSLDEYKNIFESLKF